MGWFGGASARSAVGQIERAATESVLPGEKNANMARENQRRKSRVFLVDDHPLVREHLTALLQREPDLDVCGQAADAATAFSLITRQEPDLVITDISLNGTCGLELLDRLEKSQPRLPVLVLSTHDESLYARRAFRAGAEGYITKEEAINDILPAIRQVLGGRIYLSDRMAERMAKQRAEVGWQLTEEARR
jgi:DNA-binding NarL/FixJ family response regulator